MRYHFDKSSKKFVCPKCEKKRFVRYVFEQTNEYLEDVYGRCDREQECGYFNIPQKNNGSFASPCKTSFKSLAEPTNSKTIVMSHPVKLMQQTLKEYTKNNFYLYLTSLFPEVEVLRVFDLYKVGTSKTWDGATVFWQIDNHFVIRAGKIMLYDLKSGKRIKKPYPHINWVHSRLKIQSFDLRQCLFGLHLIATNKKIALVESEKTAIIMALFMPEYTWLATGSKQNYKREFLEPIKDREIIAFPDKSEFDNWHEKAIGFIQSGFRISVSNYLEHTTCAKGADLADLYILLDSEKREVKLNKDELLVKRFASINPVVLDLIQAFKLCDSSDNPIDVDRIQKVLK